jgi:hypothetical protein
MISWKKNIFYFLKNTKFWCFALLFLSFSFVFAQKKFFLKVKNNENKMVQKSDFESFYLDSIVLKNTLVDWQKKQFEKGFLLSNVDKIERKDSTFEVSLFIGERYEWARLSGGNIPNNELEKIGFRERLFSRNALSIKELSFWFEKILTYEENNGFPFSNLRLDSVIINEQGKISARLNLNRGKKILFGEIELDDDSTQMSMTYLQHYLDIFPEQVFDKSKFSNIRNRLRELSFLSLENEPYITFEGNKAIVHLFLKKKPASRFDALLGVLPETDALSGKQKFVLTGTLNLDIQNALNRGERILVDFQRFKASEQQLKVLANYPFIANLPVGADANLDIFRRDTFFTNIEYSLGGRYILGGNNYLKVFWQTNQHNLGGIDTSRLKISKKLPDVLDIDISAYGLEWSQQRLDYRFNPRKGWFFSLKTDVGTRKIKKNDRITKLQYSKEPTFDYGTLYDTLRLSSLRFQGSLQTEFYFPIKERSTIKLLLRSDGIFSQVPVFQNEQIRFGGNRLMRGFDENSIFATRFLFNSLEYRLLIGQNSFFNVFGDFAYVENVTKNVQKYDKLLGFGAGMTFETRAGIFSLNYALGKANKNPLDFRAGKIHFGYLSLF